MGLQLHRHMGGQIRHGGKFNFFSLYLIFQNRYLEPNGKIEIISLSFLKRFLRNLILKAYITIVKNILFFSTYLFQLSAIIAKKCNSRRASLSANIFCSQSPKFQIYLGTMIIWGQCGTKGLGKISSIQLLKFKVIKTGLNKYYKSFIFNFVSNGV